MSETSSDKPCFSEMVLVRIGEIALKGVNRSLFFRQLISNIRYRLRDLGSFHIEQSQSRIWIRPKTDEFPSQEILNRISKVFGIVSASFVRAFPADPILIWEQISNYADCILSKKNKLSFKVETRRINKSFPLGSYEVSSTAGSLLLERFPGLLTVDVHNPDLIFSIEIRDQIYLYADKILAQKGLPVGTGGDGLVLLSGGIDSPVAAWMMASRGMRLDCVYFHTPPYTGFPVLNKVVNLSQILSQYIGNHRLYIVNFTSVQLALDDYVPENMLTIIMRRMMMRIASKIAINNDLKALITGESLGQVASQTLDSVVTTEQASELLILRPLIGLDKDDITLKAKQIGTYETSIQPYDDCCTVFVARHPKTTASIEDAKRAEHKLDLEQLVTEALSNLEVRTVFLRDNFS
ncbi:MAG: tRNA uracil 4-sulfurtransferase ThiI [Saccharofermentanales bacterium]